MLRSLTSVHVAQPDLLLTLWMSSPACGYRDFPVLLDPASVLTAERFTYSGFRQQRRRLGPGKPRPDCRLQVLKHRSPLLCAGRDRGPDSFAPAVSSFTPRPLRDPAVDHHEADRLLGQVVRRLHSRSRNEPEITRPMLLEPIRHVPTMSRRLHLTRSTTQNLEPGQVQLALELVRREVFSAMK